MNQKTTVTKIVQEVPEAGAETTIEQKAVPLFDLGTESDEIVSIDCERISPEEEEGYLGRIDGNSTESTIYARWGGGKYRLRAKSINGKVITVRTIVIAGDPRFMSKANAARWRRGQGIDDDVDVSPIHLGTMPSAAPGFDPLALMEMQIRQAREEREARRQDDRERDERRGREDREAEDRRRKADEAAEARRRTEDEASRERERQHNQAMMQMLTARPEGGGGAEAVAMLVKGLELGRNLGGGARDDEDDDGEGEDTLAGVIKEAVKGVAGGFMEGRRAHQRPNPGAPGGGGGGDTIRLTGPLAAKVKRLAALAKSKGLNPDEMLDGTVGKLVEAVEAAPGGGDDDDEKTNPETPAAKKAPKPKAPAKQKKPAGDK